jgi:4-amino-4-deoxy-L-arabinose transferase-like glycosyltransferase
MSETLAPHAATPPTTGTSTPQALALRAVLVVAAVKSAVNLALSNRYGWHWDELYYRVSGQHLQLGYVDFPPVTPVLARLSQALFGGSLVGLRSFSIAAGAGVVVLSALLARELGGGHRAQVLAAIVVASCPIVLGANSMFQTVPFDQLAWMGVVVLAARLLRTGATRLWLPLGLASGAALMTKYTAVPFLIAMLLGFLATDRGRAVLRTRRSVLAGALALAIVAPNLWWQVRHGWPSIGFYSHNNASVREETTRAAFVGELALIAGPVGAVLGFLGWRRLWRDDTFRPLAIAAVSVVAIFFVLGGKSYYPAPIAPLLLAAGAVHVAASTRERLARRTAVAAVLAAIVISPVVLPVLPQQTMIDVGLADARKDYAAQIGWPELAADVEAAYRSLPAAEQAGAGILTADDAAAGAVDLFGHDLPEAASTDRLYQFWPPSRPDATVVVTIGLTGDELGAECSSFVILSRIDNPAGRANEEHGLPIGVCHTSGTLESLWSDLVR